MYFRLVLVYDPVPGRCHDVALTMVDGDMPLSANINLGDVSSYSEFLSVTDASSTTTIDKESGVVSACVVNTPCNTKPTLPLYAFSVAQTNGEPLPTIDARYHNSYILEVDGVRYTPIDLTDDPINETAAGAWAYELPESTVLVALATLNDELMIQLVHVESRDSDIPLIEKPFRFTLLPNIDLPVDSNLITFVITDIPLAARAELLDYHTWVFDDGSVTSCYKPIAGTIPGMTPPSHL